MTENAATLTELALLFRATLCASIVVGVTEMVSVVVAHEMTVNINYDVETILLLIFVIVPVKVTVYTPAAVGLVHNIARFVVFKVIKVVLCPPLDAIVIV